MSHFSREPSKPSDDVIFFAAVFIGLVERIAEDDANPRWIAVGDVLQSLGQESHAIVKYENAGWPGRRAPAEVDQYDLTMVHTRSSLARSGWRICRA
jgi:hypothetical protein